MARSDSRAYGPTRSQDPRIHAGVSPTDTDTATETPRPSTAGQYLLQEIEPLAVEIGQLGPHSWWTMRGSSTQLQAEGVIPEGLVWPQGGARLRWTAGVSHYLLCRTRPEGLKGPKRLWTSGDFWVMRCDQFGDQSGEAWRLDEKRRALAEELHRQSHQGLIERHCLRLKMRDAEQDKAFQVLKAGLMPAKAAKKAGGAA